MLPLLIVRGGVEPPQLMFVGRACCLESRPVFVTYCMTVSWLIGCRVVFCLVMLVVVLLWHEMHNLSLGLKLVT